MFIYVYKHYIDDVMDSVVVSVRIKKELKEKLEKEGINVESALKDYLILRGKQLALKRTIEKAHRILSSGKVKPSKRGWAVKTIRYDRDVAH